MALMKMIRLYVLEGEKSNKKSLVDIIFQRLHEEHKILGVTQFRGIAGFGSHGMVHAADLIHMNAELPIVIEFFDQKDVVDDALGWIRELLDPGKIVSFDIEVG